MTLQHADLLTETSPLTTSSKNSTPLTSRLKDRSSRSASPSKQVTFSEKSPRYFYISQRDSTGRETGTSTKTDKYNSNSAPDWTSQRRPLSSADTTKTEKSPTLQYINDKLNRLEKQIDGFKQMQKKRAEFWRLEEEWASNEQLEEIFSHAKSRLHSSSANSSSRSSTVRNDAIVKQPLKLRTDSCSNRRPVKPQTASDGIFLGAQILEHEPSKYGGSYYSSCHQRKSRLHEKDVENISRSSTNNYNSYKSLGNDSSWRPTSCESNRLRNDFRLIKSRDSMRELENLNGDIRAKIHELRQIMQTGSPRSQMSLQRPIVI